MIAVSRRAILSLAIIAQLASGALSARGATPESDMSDADVTREAILNDPQAPVGGDPHGDVTIVAFFDYNCLNCMKTEPELVKLLKSDQHIRVVYKDWPIFGDISVYAAKIALAADLQGKYIAVHDALLATGKRKTSKDQVRDIALGAGVDMTKLDADLTRHSAEIEKLLERNDKQATGMGFSGTPVFLVGPFLIASPLDLPGFQQVVSDARQRQNP
jgi:protein-disulfide isomerase